MHIRIHRSKTRHGFREYAQLVHSYRRPDGMPAHRVLATLGPPDSLVVQNMRQALAAARAGKPSVQGPQRLAAPTRPVSNLRYLDAAVLLEVWERLGLDALFNKLLPCGQAVLCPSSVVAALVVQRCLEPGSKLFASRWVPNTALPQLLGFDAGSFNNTRVHRVLDELDEVTPSVMAELPKLYHQQTGSFKCLFLDVTDTWFVGHGPSCAQSAKTKEGMVKRKVGIVLLCNEHNFPVRWQVIEGKCCDGVAMTNMLHSLAGLSWLRAVPVVMDRAMGQSARIQQMLESDVHFLTALCKPEFSSYAPSVSYDATSSLEVNESEVQQTLALAAQRAQQAGLTKVEDDLFVLDLGIVQRGAIDQVAIASVQASDSLLEAMRTCQQLLQGVKEGRYSSQAACCRALGISEALGSKYKQLDGLVQSIQYDVLAGRAQGHDIAAMVRIAKLAKDQQRDAFEALLEKGPVKKKRPAQVLVKQSSTPVQVRAVATFNPERFVDKRLAMNRKLQRVRCKVRAVVDKANHNPKRYTQATIRLQIDRILTKESLLDVHSVHIRVDQDSEATRYQVSLELDSTKWRERRRYDGWSILVAHPAIADKSASELCKLYRAKDIIEKDFQVIKSFTMLRPVRHRTDDKVRAHVTICMLALLLERVLHGHLSSSSKRKSLQTESLSAAAALQLLEPCRLNRYAPTSGGQPAYLLTATTPEQRRILNALKMKHLAHDEYLAERLENAS